MDLDSGMLSHVILGGTESFSFLKRHGVTGEYFSEMRFSQAWEFLENHVIVYNEVPSAEYFKARTRVEVSPPQDSIKLYLEEMRRRLLWEEMKLGVTNVSEFVNAGKPEEAADNMQEVITKISSIRFSGVETEDVLKMGDEVIAAYLKIKDGERGILTPWESINDATLGFVGGDFVVLVARMGVGKTWAMLMLAMRAWMDGKKVLFVATEMARMKLAIRFFCLYLKLPYYEVTHGKLDAFREGELMTAVKDLAKQRGIQIMGDNFDAKIEEIYAAIEHDKPDVLFVDGMYLIKNKGANRHERVSNTADDLKRLAKQKNIPVVCSSQFNREVDPNNMQAVDATNVGITDVIGWNADVMYALYRTTDMEADNIMGWKPLKLREGSGKGFATNWNFRDMNFEQITAAGGFSDRDTYNGGSGSVDNGGSKIADDTDGFVF